MTARHAVLVFIVAGTTVLPFPPVQAPGYLDLVRAYEEMHGAALDGGQPNLASAGPDDPRLVAAADRVRGQSKRSPSV